MDLTRMIAAVGFVATASVVAACHRQSGADRPKTAVAAAAVAGWNPSDSTREPDYDFRRYHRDGFSIVVPRNARIIEDTALASGARTTTFAGPDINVRGKWSHNVDPVTREGPAFQLRVTSRPNSDHRTLNAIAGAAAHTDSLHADELSPPSDMTLGTIADQPVLITHASSGDSAPTGVLFVSPTTIVGFGWDTGDNDLLADVTVPFYWYMLSTFRWDGPGTQ